MDFRQSRIIAILGLTTLGLMSCAPVETSSNTDDGRSVLNETVEQFIPGIESRPQNTECLAENFTNQTTAQPDTSDGSVRKNSNIQLKQVYSSIDLNQPIAMIPAPDDDQRWYVAERTGVIRSFRVNDSQATVVADFSHLVRSSGEEQGLLGIAFHPSYPAKREVFISYIQASAHSVISRFNVSADGLTIDPRSEQVVLFQRQPFGNHNGGHIAFGPDGYLYIGFGDGGSGGDPDNNAQNTGNLLGSMLRIDINESPYAIPEDNPFAGQSCANAACPEIWAWGLRNPWRWSFDRFTGKLWAGDVGQDKWEEVSILESGGNYGWRCYEGDHAFNLAGCSNVSDYRFPVAEYTRDQGRSITGGYVYRGNSMTSLAGTYLFADFVTGHIWGIHASQQNPQPQRLIDGSGLNIASFAQATDGELYILDFGGRIYQIQSATTISASAQAPLKLSATGCVEPNDPTRFRSGVIPFSVNSLLWSDNALKHRWLAIPEGEQISVQADGDWIFPAGSVLVKDFWLQNKVVETRFLANHEGQWRGYTYAWNEAGTDADLVNHAVTRHVQGQDWDFPAGQCFQCHTHATGIALGPENAQLNLSRTFLDSGIISNQLGTMASIGLLSGFDREDLAKTDALADWTDESAPLDARARAYLHSNCSGCHRPLSNGRGPLDFRYQATLDDMSACGKAAQFGSVGSNSGHLLNPGNGADSVIVNRMKSLNPATRMPPLGTSIVDEKGVGLIQEWIDSISACN